MCLPSAPKIKEMPLPPKVESYDPAEDITASRENELRRRRLAANRQSSILGGGLSSGGRGGSGGGGVGVGKTLLGA